MARSKNKAIRRPDDAEVTSRKPSMKLRSPSVRRPSTKLMKTPPPKPTTGIVYAESHGLSSPVSSSELPDPVRRMCPEVRNTERSRAIMNAMADESSRRVKRLDAITTPPVKKKKKKMDHGHGVRNTPPRKAKKIVPQPPALPHIEEHVSPALYVPPQEEHVSHNSHGLPVPWRRKNRPPKALPDIEPPQDIHPPLPVKRKTTSDNPMPDKHRKTTATSSQPRPAPNHRELEAINLPAATNSNPTPRAPATMPAIAQPNPLLPRRSPRSLAKSAGRRKCPFHMKAAKLATKGDKAHFIATFSQVYSGDPRGAALAEKIQEMVRQALADQNGEESEHSVLDDHEPLPITTQIDIISQVVGQKRGTYVSGTGKAFKRPPLPRGGARNSKLKEQLQKQEDAFEEMKAEFQQRIQVLEDLVVRGGSANLASQNASEGATSYVPNANN